MQSSKKDYEEKWDLFFAEGDYHVAVALNKMFEDGRMEELGFFLKKNIENAIKNHEFDIKDKLTNLMKYIILWKFSEEYRTEDTVSEIGTLRIFIEDAVKYEGCLSNDTILKYWNRALNSAKNLAETYVKEAADLQELTWDEVLDKTYRVDYGK